MATLSQLPQGQSTDLSIARFFNKLQDPRRAHRRLHLLQDIIVIALCAVIAGAQDWQQIETFGRKRRDWLRGFLALPHGIPSHDTFERVFDRLQPWAFLACLSNRWTRESVGAAVTVTSPAIGFSKSIIIGNEGQYKIRYLMPGEYLIKTRSDSPAKSFWMLYAESHRLMFRVEALNSLNTPEFSNPAATLLTPSTFGRSLSTISSVAGFGSNRQIQFAVRYTF